MVGLEYNEELGRYKTYNLTEKSFIEKHSTVYAKESSLRLLYHQLNASSRICWCGDIDLTHFALTSLKTYAADTRMDWDLELDKLFFTRIWESELSFHLVGKVILSEFDRPPHTMRYLSMKRSILFPHLLSLN